ncbi:MAG: bifunctional isocitrate dehydrogenase kinase/phosphatase, partial [Candidatus Omnitrophica bacterium]|nr:bifunctional isocitrate dehydrogenase kinase/phosphatase [Candidatus Omnitrophota bacterium]
MKLNCFYRATTFLLLATLSFSSSIAYPDIPQVLAKGDRLPKINLFPFSRDSLTKLKATAQTEFVRSELRNMLGFPKENAFPFRNPRRRARLIDLSSFSPSPLYIKQGKDRNEGVLVRSELRSNAESDHSKSSFNWWWIAAPFQMLAQMARRLWLQIQQKTRTRNKIIMISARTIFRTFDANQIAVQQITRRAKSRFETHDQRGSLRDEKNRRELYQHVMDKVVHDLQVRTPNSLSDFKFWHDLKASYSELIKDRYDQDKARIFFNSVARRFLSADVTRVMYTPDEILQSEKRKQAPTPIFKTYLKGTENTNQVVSEVFSDYPFAIRYRDLASDIQHVTEKIEEFLVGTLQSKDFYALEILEPLALRDGKAYLIGYIVADKERLLIIPCVIQLDNQEEFNQGGKQVGVFVSNVFLGKQLAGNIFTFSRSGFYIDTPYYRELVEFLERAAPRKASYELYWNIGDHPHARSKFYELLQLHLKEDGAQFTSVTELQKPSQDPIIAFTLPGFDNVFQLVRSHDQKGKAVDREVVKKRYDYVLQTDRKGWLLGGLKFGELKFRQSAFSEPLLQVLRTEASYKDSDVVFEGDFVIFKLLYVQNRVFPLNEFLKQDQSREEQVKAIRSFGDFVRGLAEAGVFYGNYDLSKVAITAYGKVVGFDYSMLGAIGRYHFSDSRAKGRRTAAKIPQEFLASFIPSSLLPVFQETHGDLLTAKFWNQMKWTRQISGEIHSAFNTYLKEFGEITSRAQSRFENRDWRGVVDDVREKLELYPHALDQMLNRFQSVFAHISDDEWKSEEFWLSIKEKYAEQVAHQYDADLAFIFFYSVMRRVLARYGIPVEYGDDGIVENREISIDQPLYRVYEQERNETVGQLLKRIVLNFGLQAPFQNLDQDVSVASNILAGDLQKKFGSTAFERIEILKPLFFRNKGAYVIGRIKVNGEWMPLVLPLIHKEKGIKIHAVLTDRSDVSNVFSFTRSSFQVDSTRYREMIDFLETIMPSKGKTALYSSIGFIQPAKIQFIKELRDHLQRTGEHFVPTEGI